LFLCAFPEIGRFLEQRTIAKRYNYYVCGGTMRSVHMAKLMFLSETCASSIVLFFEKMLLAFIVAFVPLPQ